MRLTCSTSICPDLLLPQALDFVKKAGFEAIELFRDRTASTPVHPDFTVGRWMWNPRAQLNVPWPLRCTSSKTVRTGYSITLSCPRTKSPFCASKCTVASENTTRLKTGSRWTRKSCPWTLQTGGTVGYIL